MILAKALEDYLKANAKNANVALPEADDDLFKAGVLDSFAIADFVTMIEEEYNISIPDSDIKQDTFLTINKIKDYIQSHKG